MTFADVITGAMFDLGILQEGEVPTQNQQEMVKSRANDWIDGLATLSLTVYEIERTVWTLTNQAIYGVGFGGDIDIARPVNPAAVANIGYINNNFPIAVETLFDTLLTDDEYAAIPIKSFSSLYPTAFYYRPTFPLGGLIPYPIPSSAGLQGVIYTSTAVPEFTDTSNVIALPPGYRRWFRTAFAMEIAPLFNADPSPALIKAFTEAEANVKRANERLSDMGSDALGLFSGNCWPKSNIYTGP